MIGTQSSVTIKGEWNSNGTKRSFIVIPIPYLDVASTIKLFNYPATSVNNCIALIKEIRED